MSDPIKEFNPADLVPRALEDVQVEAPLVTSYTAKVGQTFRVNGNAELTLVKADPSVKFKVAPGQQPPDDVPVGVKLVFEGPSASELPEGTYLVEGDGTSCHLYLMPIFSPAGTQYYQAVDDE